ncbi:hypothetical protein HW555_005963 [Spodoptera exigua]|uniref:Uncharacterized protein n=1 Tax=Spodoptera exigua TaxID=7107 RepID=A0A835LAL9_SPOEX|nr:hypothetical protein HW555_005963 [Spodoptera exigua]
MPPYVQEFNRKNVTTAAPAAASDMDSKPQESTSNSISTQLNEPNRIGDSNVMTGEVTNDPANVNVTEKLKD